MMQHFRGNVSMRSSSQRKQWQQQQQQRRGEKVKYGNKKSREAAADECGMQRERAP